MTDLYGQGLALRQVVSDLSTLATRDLTRLFDQYKGSPKFAEVLRRAYPELVRPYASAAAVVSAKWYDGLDPESDFQAEPILDLPIEGMRKSADWALHAPGDADPLMRLAGSTKRRIADESRRTVLGNANREGVRWARVAAPGACAFCRMLTTRGPVYSSQANALAGHDHCACVAVPVRSGASWEPPEYVRDWEDEYEKASRSGDPLATMRKTDWLEEVKRREEQGEKVPRRTRETDDAPDESGNRERSTRPVTIEPEETDEEKAARLLPGFEQRLQELRDQGLADDSDQVQYHLQQIERWRRHLPAKEAEEPLLTPAEARRAAIRDLQRQIDALPKFGEPGYSSTADRDLVRRRGDLELMTPNEFRAANPGQLFADPRFTSPNMENLADKVFPGLPRKTALTGVDELQDDVSASNPYHKRDASYQVNCTNCVTAFELRQRGYDVEAKAIPTNGRQIGTVENAWQTKDGERRSFEPVSAKTIKQEVGEWDDGARGFVVITWSRQSGGHIFSVVNEGGKARFIDPQVGAEDASDYLTRGEMFLMRVDDLVPANPKRLAREWVTPAGDDPAPAVRRKRRGMIG